ncbi:hypothetical protein JKP88DRAFT_175935 [Tribonema minus]|uniref:Ankyrin repeat domain-containing protein n=1 Tax=Tribonema minus TaxID=303371 RepID=A0A835ZAT3_9STRA|nr:hypothetical protein JKP88DRAFT_175935 [Tribonema minus]
MLADRGRLDVLQWGTDTHGFRPSAEVAMTAARSGQVQVLQWLHELMPWSAETTHNAARRGQRASLEWLEDVFEDATPWDASIFAHAAESGDLALLHWLREHECPWDERASRQAAVNGHVQDEAFEWAYGHGLPVAAKTEADMAERGDVARLKWLRARGHAFQSPPDMWAVADFGTMRWLQQHRFPCDERAMAAALERGDADAVRWLVHEVGHAACDHHACIAAASAGDLASLAPLHAACRATGGGGHDADVCAAAAAGGHMDVLRWARGAGCAWDERVCAQARANGHLEVLRWAVSQRCPCDVAELVYMMQHQRLS